MAMIINKLIRVRNRKLELIKENPEYEGKLFCFANNEIFCTSNKDIGIYLKIDEISDEEIKNDN